MQKREASYIKISDVVMIKGCPCKVIAIKTGSINKQSMYKVKVTGLSIINEETINGLFKNREIAYFPINKLEWLFT